MRKGQDGADRIRSQNSSAIHGWTRKGGQSRVVLQDSVTYSQAYKQNLENVNYNELEGDQSYMSESQMRELGREVDVVDGTELIYEHHYAPVETVVYEQPVPLERERIYYEPAPTSEHIVKTKVIDITKSASYAEYAKHKADLEKADKSEFDNI